MGAETTLREMFDLPNTGLKFLFDERQTQHSAQARLQWCLDPDAITFLRNNKVADPLLLIEVTSPKGYKQRYLVSFWKWEVLIPFYAAGKHTITGRIFWDFESPKAAKKICLEKNIYYKREYLNSFDSIEYQAKGLGKAELSVDVADGFFAKPLSNWEEWWLELWLGELYDECYLRRRRLFAYTIQALFVGIWLVAYCLLRVGVAATLSGLLLQRKVHWSVVLHPFEHEFKYIWHDYFPSERSREDMKSFSRIIYDKNGRSRSYWGSWRWVFFPPLYFVLLLLSGLIGWFSETPMETFFWTYLFLLGTIATGISLVAGVAGLGFLIAWTWVAIFPKKTAQLAKEPRQVQMPAWFLNGLEYLGDKISSWLSDTFTALEERSEARVAKQLELAYADLQCDRAPAVGLRPISAVPFSITRTPRLAYHAVKAMVCKPMQRG